MSPTLTDSSRFSLLVLGAGISGISAAASFLRATSQLLPRPTVAVLEASHRIGGRLKTSTPEELPCPPGPFDLGGAWVTGFSNNALVHMVKEVGAKFKGASDRSTNDAQGSELPDGVDESTETAAEEISDAFAYPSFQPIPQADFARASDRAAKLLMRVRAEFGAPGRSLAQAVELLDEKLQEEAGLRDRDSGDGEVLGIDWLTLARMKAATEPNDGLPFEEVSSLEFEEIGNSPTGSEYATVEGGLASVVKRYAALESVPVQFGAHVEEVMYGAVDGCSVRTKDGTVWTADHVICTFPHTVLLSRLVTFHPPLPTAFTSALSVLGRGTLSKLILLFPHRFWTPGAGGIDLVLETTHTRPPRDFPASFLVAEALGLTEPYPDDHVGERLHALVGFCWGDVARAVERDPEEAARRSVEALRKCYGEDKVPTPTHVLSTSWISSPLSLGSYAAAPVSTLSETLLPNLRAILPSTGTVGTLRFAGEWTAGPEDGIGYAHGGAREGKRVGEEVARYFAAPEANNT
ncbi:amine oxidase [Gonapodya prolifera JEL478]|uniref:Amine oxidase n=1 Tax=Gonapodya prolifera (strain JEL478) TaxID=1344416 RepID=A0A139ACF7_GONPJ|nr:amine oxidase [Gonapodya prolifera JEL478]|eukprot:KXS14457.1 amine oxidase [Gonapodya prolifera JEL478]